MLLRIQSFIGQHLGDPGLSPAMIAAAHHISVRTLHKLYEAEGQPIAASIRRQRLERCHQDLLDPGLRDCPVSAVGARWGFRDTAAFGRVFRSAYGVPPGEYRAAQLSSPGLLPRGGNERCEHLRAELASSRHIRRPDRRAGSSGGRALSSPGQSFGGRGR
jgi:AraC-like DNA-binding protein